MTKALVIEERLDSGALAHPHETAIEDTRVQASSRVCGLGAGRERGWHGVHSLGLPLRIGPVPGGDGVVANAPATRLELLACIRDALRVHPHIGPLYRRIALHIHPGALWARGELPGLSVKRRAACAMRALLAAETALVDELTVTPVVRMSDLEIRHVATQHLREDPSLERVEIVGWYEQGSASDPPRAASWIGLSVHRGVVWLDGSVPNLVQKDIAEVFAWWSLGARDVRNRIDAPAPADGAEHDAAIRAAIAYAFDREPLLEHSAIEVEVNAGCVTLRGRARDAAARAIAELDAWLLSDVREVQSEIEHGAC